MYGLFSRRLVIAHMLSNSNRSVVQDLAITYFDSLSRFGFIQKAGLFPLSIKFLSTGDEQVRREQSKECSFTVSYLINSCGLSSETAKFVAKRVKIQSSKQPDSVLKFFRNHGFTNTHIAKLVRGRPVILLAHPERSILPKIEFLKSFGVTDAEIAHVCSSNSAILCHSLENQLIPSYNFLKSVVLSDENVVKTFRKKSRIFTYDLQKKVSPKLAAMRELGMPESFISLVLTCYAAVVLQRQDKFDATVKKVIELGFDPQKCTFIRAMQVFTSISQPNREHKLDVFRKWGWSDEDIKLAFKRRPNYLVASENKIISVFDFLVNKMGWQSTAVAKYPIVFLMNLEKRTIPRCLVIKVLQLKGLEKKSFGQVLTPVEKIFFERFVAKHVDDIPQLVNIYLRKEGIESLGLSDFVSSSLSTSQN